MRCSLCALRMGWMMNKKVVTVVLEVESDDDYMMTDEFIKNDLEQEINCASNSYKVVSITIGHEVTS